MNSLDIKQTTANLAEPGGWHLLCDLLSFENQALIVKMSLDGGQTVEALRIRLNELVIDHEVTIRKLVDYLRISVNHSNSKAHLLCRNGQMQRPISHLVKKQGCCVLHGET